jgi:predicted phage terminase large subunit-like protein|tara:strand:- start:12292 stop:13542 length:1251 start_codon:yes stop_codon:yes gene_type:complete
MTSLNIQLLDWQKQVWADDTRFKIVAAGRRTGKSRLAAWMLIVNALQADKGHVFYVAPTQGQARDIMWQTLLELAHPIVSSSHINNLQIKLVNGATISLKGADRPETMRGVSLKFLVMDEYADMKPEVFEQILRPALADQKGGALFIGTPMGRNHFYDLYKYAELEDDESYQSWHFTSYDNELLDPDEIDLAKKSMSSYAFRQEFMASFEARGSEMFKEEWVKFGETPEIGDYYISIDLAGFEDVSKKRTKNSRLDESAIAVVKVNEDGWHLENIIYGRWDLAETARKIFEAVRDYRPISVGIERGIAKQAVMSPLMDLMKQRGRFFVVEELTHGNKKKTDRIMWALQGRFENGQITLGRGEWNSKFLDQLFQFPDVLTHDDLVDAFAYTDQLAKVAYSYDFEIDDLEVLDVVTGY